MLYYWLSEYSGIRLFKILNRLTPEEMAEANETEWFIFGKLKLNA